MSSLTSVNFYLHTHLYTFLNISFPILIFPESPDHVGDPILQILSLKPKLYSVKNLRHTKKRAKGVSTALVRDKLTHAHFNEVLETQNPIYLEHTTFISRKLQLYTETYSKKSVTCVDLKRYWKGVTSVPFGYPTSDPENENVLLFDIE